MKQKTDISTFRLVFFGIRTQLTVKKFVAAIMLHIVEVYDHLLVLAHVEGSDDRMCALMRPRQTLQAKHQLVYQLERVRVKW